METHEITISLSKESVQRIAATGRVHAAEIPEIVRALEKSVRESFLVVIGWDDTERKAK